MNFRTDISELSRYFDGFSSVELIGIVTEQSLHYYNMAKKYKKANQGTKVEIHGFQVLVALNFKNCKTHYRGEGYLLLAPSISQCL